MFIPRLIRLRACCQRLHAALPSCTTCIPGSATSYSTDATDIINKWQGLLSINQFSLSAKNQSSKHLQGTQQQLRQLVRDAIYIYKSEGAAAVLPDQITDVFMSAYAQLSTKQQRLMFFTLLAQEFGVQSTAVEAAVELWQNRVKASTGAAPELLYRLADKLVSAAQPLYMQLLLPVSQHKAGIGFLVGLRADLLQLLREQPGLSQAAALRALSEDLRSALARWFSVGLVQLERITWERTPGLLLERVMSTEAVHHMQHMEELKRRLQQSDRRVFAFLHPSLPCEPLVVLHTALMNHIPKSMQEVLSEPQQPPRSSTLHSTGSQDSKSSKSQSSVRTLQHPDVAHTASVACFYSISSGQPGLSGVDLGNFLIKKAALLLITELPQLQQLVTLSPVPGFRAWLITRLQQDAAGVVTAHQNSNGSSLQSTHGCLLQQREAEALLAASDNSIRTQGGVGNYTLSSAAAHLLELVKHNVWLECSATKQAVIESVLLRLCAVYLLKERRRGYALDPVAHFHLKNGAVLWHINPRADLSAAGLERSCGLMVNYRYVLSISQQSVISCRSGDSSIRSGQESDQRRGTLAATRHHLPYEQSGHSVRTGFTIRVLKLSRACR